MTGSSTEFRDWSFPSLISMGYSLSYNVKQSSTELHRAIPVYTSVTSQTSISISNILFLVVGMMRITDPVPLS